MTVHLVGAGPGDPDLLTVRAVRLLERADAVVFDRLVGEAVVDLAPRAELIDAGKRPGGPRTAQDDLNAELARLGSIHPTVVRLKGGDPYLFGRGAEEAQYLIARGIEVEVVPGVSSAFAGPLAAGIPVTHRSVSAGVTVVTASTAPDTSGIDWPTLAGLGHTLVVLMGVRRAPAIASTLIEHGRSSFEPVAVVGSATTGRQRAVRTTLAGLAAVDVPAPAVIVVGPVAALPALPTWIPSPTTRPTTIEGASR